MKTIIAGSRNITDYKGVAEFLAKRKKNIEIIVLKWDE